LPSLFTRIINGEIPSYKIAENTDFYAFLDINPLAKGHALVIPKKEVDYIFDLEDNTYTGLFEFSKKVSVAIESVVECERIGVSVIGLEVPHAHVHLIPINQIGDMNFSNSRITLSQSEFSDIANKIRANFEK
jgi:histidine triad (HIT) family protein